MKASARPFRTPGVVLGLLLCCGSPSAFALNPALDVSQYAHTAWKSREGFIKGTISSMTQTPDGYLWLGTEFGLVRFDGVKAVTWQPPPGEPLPSSSIWSLLSSRDGTLWIGTSKGLASWREGKLTRYPELDGQYVHRLFEDRAGLVWVGTIGIPTGRLCEIRKGSVRCEGANGRLGPGVVGLYENARGWLWVGVKDGLWRWKPDPAEFHSMPGELDSLRTFEESDNGALLVSTKEGIRRLIGGKTELYPIPGTSKPISVHHLFRDREGSLWIGTDQGLSHVHQGRTDHFARADGLSGDYILTLFQDREGSIWVATYDGLDQFRDVAVPTFGVRQGLSGASVVSVLAAPDGNVWLGGSGGLNQWTNGRLTEASVGGQRHGQFNGRSADTLFQDDRGRLWISTMDQVGFVEQGRFIPVSRVPSGVVRDMVQDTQGNVWIASLDHGLFRVSVDRTIQQFPWVTFGHEDFASALAADRLHGGLWLGFFNGGLVYFSEGRVQASYTSAGGLGPGRVNSLQFQPDGTLWAATAGGLSVLKGGRVVTLTSSDGLPCDAVHWAMKDDVHSLWLYMPCGLVRIRDSDFESWVAQVDKDGSTARAVQSVIFDSSDGVEVRAEPSGYSPRVTKSTDGRIWFIGHDGVSVVDPRHASVNSLPPPVHIQNITADRREYAPGAGRIDLPALTRDLQIDYTALSLVAPEKNRFRIWLEGRDPGWRDVGTRRQAFYNDLAPGPYRFHVIASNNSGIWNETGDVLEFSIAPAWYQRPSVRTATVVGFVALLWAMYRYRVRQIAQVYDARLQARVDERTRIARDLHDTLLQSLHGLLFRFQAAANLLPNSPGEAKQQLERTIAQTAAAITEGRDAVQNLRASPVVTSDLAGPIGALVEELSAGAADGRPSVDVRVAGAPRDLNPVVRDEIYRIGAEALRNAFRHARARRIEVEMRYEAAEFQLCVRDDGQGIDAGTLDEPEPGHFGLAGMRERAEGAGGHLEVWSEHGVGTEIDVTIPAAAAYQKPGRTS